MSNFVIFIFVERYSTMAKKVYNKIKAILAEEGKSNKELGELLKTSEQTVSRWCTNTRQPSIEMLYEIARVLKRDVRDFLVDSR